MRPFLPILFTLFVIPSSLIGQITINATDIIGFAEYVELADDTIPSISHTAGGPNQTWNFSGQLNNHGTNSFGFTTASFFDGYLEFPNAPFGSGQGNSSIFLNKTPESLDLFGIYGDFLGTGNPESLKFDSLDRLMTFPSTYETEYFNSYTSNLSIDASAFGLDSAVIDIQSDKTSIIDAWGTLTTDFGTFEVIRQYVYEVTTNVTNGYLFGASVFNDTQTDETHRYVYWTNDPTSKYVVLEYDYNPFADIVNSATWQIGSPVLSVPFNNLMTTKIFPNPCAENLSIEFPTNEVFEFVIYNSLGQNISTGKVSNGQHISVVNLDNGNYILELRNSNGHKEFNKFVVYH